MPHRNAPLTETGRLRLARCVVDDGWPVRRAGERFQVSPTTAARWAARYRQYGPAGMADRTSRPQHSPNQLPRRTERRIIGLRVSQRLGPARIAYRLGLHPSTVHRVLTRYGCPRLRAWTGPPACRCAGMSGTIPASWSTSTSKSSATSPTAAATASTTRPPASATAPIRNPALGYGYLHTALDDHSRLAYTEILADERKETAVAFLHRAYAWYAAHGITIERILSDNGSCYRSRDWAATCARLAITHKRTRPYRPQTNGKIERYHRTLADEWAYARPYATETARRAALPGWLHTYNNHRGHTALGGNPPASRVPNLSGQNN